MDCEWKFIVKEFVGYGVQHAMFLHQVLLVLDFF